MKRAVGIGCRAEASGEAIARLARQALLAVVPAKAEMQEAELWAPDFLDNPALDAAAKMLGLALRRCDAASLRAVAGQVVSHSPRVAALHGVGSVAEAAALVGAGAGARVIAPKMSADGVSVAVAEGKE